MITRVNLCLTDNGSSHIQNINENLSSMTLFNAILEILDYRPIDLDSALIFKKMQLLSNGLSSPDGLIDEEFILRNLTHKFYDLRYQVELDKSFKDGDIEFIDITEILDAYINSENNGETTPLMGNEYKATIESCLSHLKLKGFNCIFGLEDGEDEISYVSYIKSNGKRNSGTLYYPAVTIAERFQDQTTISNPGAVISTPVTKLLVYTTSIKDFDELHKILNSYIAVTEPNDEDIPVETFVSESDKSLQLLRKPDTATDIHIVSSEPYGSTKY